MTIKSNVRTKVYQIQLSCPNSILNSSGVKHFSIEFECSFEEYDATIPNSINSGLMNEEIIVWRYSMQRLEDKKVTSNSS